MSGQDNLLVIPIDDAFITYDDDYAANNLWSWCKNYNETYDFIDATYKSLFKYYKVIRICEGMLSIPKDMWYPVLYNKKDFTNHYGRVDYDLVLRMYASPRMALTHMKQLCYNINMFEDEICNIRRKVCEYMNTITAKVGVSLTNWKSVNKFINSNTSVDALWAMLFNI